ncbi:hypothetical protein A3715_04630 [Oleiphilus sp. HI0009]|uniref:AAA family ATPase n=8 Tax=Oleiphilus TaxID=141450 RepID=UPI0007C3E13A|nr:MULTISPECIES: AAA family ATPase [unclassified Oleiphilus]KZX84230.1 hypothetical protein A3715_04630 [Oleiphilus sp. HI0009]KZY67920.1 hypothetical protein A3738_04990 [Oleiphilus sp. HI0066]KZY70286.1 hypothetical protein A3739_00450 [Oleiphilus sp. HI0067]
MSQAHFLSIAKRLCVDDAALSAQLSEGQGFFFKGAQRQHQLESVRHLACFGDLLLWLHAPKGSGKTHLIDQIHAELKSELNLISISAEADMTPADIVQAIADQSAIFASPSENVESLLVRCRESYKQLYREKGNRTLITIDDAEHLSQALLKSCIDTLELPQSDTSVVLLLASTSELAWLSANYGDESVHAFGLPLLSVEEVKAFIEQGLSSVGFSSTLSIPEASVERLHIKTQGLVSEVQRHMGAVLFNSTDDAVVVESQRSQPRLPAFALVTIVLILMASFLFVAQQHNLFSGMAQQEFASESVVIDEEAQRERLARLDEALRQSEKFDVVQEAVVVENESSLAVNETLAAENVASDDLLETKESAKEDSDLVGSKGAQSDDPVLANEKNNDAADTDSGVTALESSVKPESEVVRTSTENLGTDMPEDKVIKVSVKKSQEDSSVFGGANYTLQVLGSYNESTAQRFVESNQLPDLYYVRSTYKGKAWFVVLYGRFESAFDARSADLPDVVASQKPWVRSVDGLR